MEISPHIRRGATGARSNVSSVASASSCIIAAKQMLEVRAERGEGREKGDAYVCVRGSRKKLQKVILVGEKSHLRTLRKLAWARTAKAAAAGATCAAHASRFNKMKQRGVGVHAHYSTVPSYNSGCVLFGSKG